MTGDLLINDVDAYDNMGINMGDGFLDAILAPPPMKDCVENFSRKKDGKTIDNSDPKMDVKTLSLTFVIEGATKSEYLLHLKSFYSILGGSKFYLKIPPLGNEVYKLRYTKSSTYNGNVNRTSSKVTLNFEEPNPNDRM